MTVEQQQVLIDISDVLGVRDYEFLYVSSMVILDLVATIAVYILLIKAFRIFSKSGCGK